MGYRTYTIKRTPVVKKFKKSQIILISAIVGAAIVFLCLIFGTSVFVDKSSTLMSTEAPVAEKCVGNSSGVISINNNNITFFDLEGFIVWQTETDSTYDNISASDTAFALYNSSSATFFDLNGQPLFKAEMDSPITDVICGNNTFCVLVSQKEESLTSSFMHVYDTDGQELSVIEFTSKHILQTGISGSTDTIYALSLDTTGVIPVCYITTYKNDGTITGSISINSQIIEKISVSDTGIFASGTNSLTRYSYFGEEEKDLLIYGWKPYDSFVSGSDFLMLYTTRSEQALSDNVIYNIKVIDSDLQNIMIYFPEALKYACCSSTKIYAFGENNIYIYDKNGTLTETIHISNPLTNVVKLSNGYAVLWDNENSYFLKLY